MRSRTPFQHPTQYQSNRRHRPLPTAQRTEGGISDLNVSERCGEFGACLSARSAGRTTNGLPLPSLGRATNLICSVLARLDLHK